MTTEASHHNGTFQARDTDELRDTLFRTLRDLRSGRITAHQANAVTTAATKALMRNSVPRQRVLLWVNGGIVSAFSEKAAFGSRIRRGAHGIAKNPAQPLSTLFDLWGTTIKRRKGII